MKFLKYTLASIVGVLIASAIIFFIFLGIVGSMISSGEKETVSISPKTILVMKLDQTIKERTSANPLQNFDLKKFESQTALGLNDILLNIQKAKDDENIKGIFLDLGVIPAGINTIEEIRNALLDFKKSGKFVIAYADYYTQPAYYLATAANKIYLNPAGKLLFLGLKSQITFIKGTLDKLGLEPEIIRHGKFKSAVEPLMMDKMSKENREQVMVYISSIWNHLLEGISAQRKVSIPALNHLADNMTIDDAQSAASHKLVDGTKYKDQVFDELAKLSGQPNADKLNFVNLNKYDNVPMPRKEKHVIKNKIAIIYAQGDIVLGEGDEDNIGSEKYAKAIREARKDTSIKAIVLRVNSGGGDALASEIIWREVFLAKKAKPVIASMGDVAASGGYYILAASDCIVAGPNTITGSIGVFGILMNTQKFFNKKLGVTFDVAKTNPHADLGTIARPLTAQEKEVVQASVERTYDDFISHVAQGRHKTKAQIDKIGQGRVWSGVNAKSLGLIDQFGGINKAIEIAAHKAKLKNYRIVSYPKLIDPFTQLFNSLTSSVESKFLKNNLADSYQYYENIQKIINTQGIRAQIPYSIELY